MLEAAVFPAGEMKGRGFLARVVRDGQAKAEAEAAARRICALSPHAARLNKQTLRKLGDTPAAVESAYAYADSPGHREGIAAFIKKRKPDFRTDP